MARLPFVRGAVCGLAAVSLLIAAPAAEAVTDGLIFPDFCPTVACATVTFLPYTLGVNNGSGTVTSEPEGINCTITAGVTSGTCSVDFLGQSNPFFVTLRRKAAPGSVVHVAEGYDSGDISTGVNLYNGDSVVWPVDFRLKKYVLAVTKTGAGTGKVMSQPLGIDCGSSCTKEFDHGANATLTAIPDAGAVFKSWTGACFGQDATCDLTITAATSTNAVFELPTAGGGPTVSQPAGNEPTGNQPTGSEQADTTVDVDVIGAKGAKSRIGKRIIQLELLLDENVSVKLTLVRGDKTLATKTIQKVKEGDRVLNLLVPGNVAKGKAKLTFELTDAAGNIFSATRNVKVPKK